MDHHNINELEFINYLYTIDSKFINFTNFMLNGHILINFVAATTNFVIAVKIITNFNYYCYY